jgi:DNA repair protein RecO (recombination protein O)
MARITSSEAVVLQTRPYRETSKLVTVFTRDWGKVQLQAKGARRPRSKFGAALEVASLIRIIFYRTERKHIYTLSDAEIIEDLRDMRDRQEHLRAALVAAEFTNRNFEWEAPNSRVFRLLRETLAVLQSFSGDPLVPAYVFMFKVAEALGYAPQLDHCVSCRRTKAAAFAPRLGGLLCARCVGQEPDAIRVDLPILRQLRSFRGASIGQNARQGAGPQMLDLVHRYLQYHIEYFDLRTLRSLRDRPARAGPCP